jgi:hypothetical protein
MSAIGYVDENGKYHKGIDKPLPHDINTQHKAWTHSDQRKRFARDILQPHAHGKHSREFIKYYDEDVIKRYFSEDDIKKAERQLNE